MPKTVKVRIERSASKKYPEELEVFDESRELEATSEGLLKFMGNGIGERCVKVIPAALRLLLTFKKLVIEGDDGRKYRLTIIDSN